MRKRLDAQARENLGLAAVLMLYLLQVLKEISRPFWFLGADFIPYWSAGYLTNTQGFLKIYDFAALEAAEHLVVFGQVLPDVHFPPLPMAYLPVFVLPFRLLALLPPKISFALWTVFNLALGAGYLVYYTREIHTPQKKRLLFFFALSFPFFQTLFWGQVNMWLLVAAGEFIRAFRAGREWRAGLWLSLLLLKPQLLFVILPALLVSRHFKTLAGATLGALALFLGSFWVGGREGFLALGRLWLGYTQNLATSGVEAMGNWRMVAEQLNHLFPSATWTWMAALAALLTLGWVVWLWYQGWREDRPVDDFLLLATFSASLLTAWHSHAHTAVILIPVLLGLALRGQLPRSLLDLWLFLPPVLYVLGLFAVLLLQDRFYNGLLYAPAQFTLNLVFLYWSSRQVLAARKAEG